MFKKILYIIILYCITFTIFINDVNASSEFVKFTYFNQKNYSHVPYCSGKYTVATSGCGATSLAIIVNAFTDRKYNPEIVSEYLCEHGFGNGAGTSWKAYTDEELLDYFDLTVDVLFKVDSSLKKGDAGQTYDAEKGNQILKSIQNGMGVILNIPNHYVVIGPNEQCKSNEVYYYQVSNSDENGCYTPKELFEQSYNYRNRCTNAGNCGWKGAFAFKNISKIKVYFNANGAEIGNDKYKLSDKENILKVSDDKKYYKEFKYNDVAIDLPNFNGSTFKMSYIGMKNGSPFWNTKADGSGDKFYQTSGKQDAKELFDAAGCSLDEDCSITLYGQWKPINYLIHYVGNGANGQTYDVGHCTTSGKCGLDVYTLGTEYDEDTQTFKHATKHYYNTTVTLKKNRFYKDGYVFDGWSETPTGVVKYKDTAEVKNLSTTDGEIIYLYAQWIEGQKDTDNDTDTEEPDVENNDNNNEDNTDNISNSVTEPEDESDDIEYTEDEEGYIDEIYGDEVDYENKETTDNITESPQTGIANIIIVCLVCLCSLLFVFFYKKINT